MILKIASMLMGKKLKAKAVDAVLDAVDLPGPTEAAIKAAVTGNPGDLLGAFADKGKKAVRK